MHWINGFRSVLPFEFRFAEKCLKHMHVVYVFDRVALARLRFGKRYVGKGLRRMNPQQRLSMCCQLPSRQQGKLIDFGRLPPNTHCILAAIALTTSSC